jgi:F-box protein 18 (helicase)
MTKRLENADIVLSTAHKAKGLEFDTVKITEDFMLSVDALTPVHLEQCDPDEKNLLYVAVSR